MHETFEVRAKSGLPGSQWALFTPLAAPQTKAESIGSLCGIALLSRRLTAAQAWSRARSVNSVLKAK